MKSFIKDKLMCNIYDSRDEMGKAAADDAAKILCKLLAEQDEVNVIFAAAPSQNEMLSSLVAHEGIDWSRVNAFHMDEYSGLDKDAPQGFYNFLNRAIFSKLPFRSVHRISCDKTADKAIAEYTELLASHPCDLCLMGIGENGHIAFNDPHEADFCDKAVIKAVTLDDTCRMQQVNDGCFASFDDVPRQALTLTVPTLVSAKHIICVVPAKTKANAVKRMLTGDINEQCPATAIRNHIHAALYLDPDSASLL